MKKKINPAVFYRRLSLVALAAVLAVSGAAARVAPGGSNSTGIENFGRVNEHYYRGGQPDAEGFARLKELGVKTVIDLRKDSVRKEAEWVGAQGMRYVNIPMTASKPATDEQVEQFLKTVNDPASWPVYVHCKGGRHRTGAMTAAYRITHDGWTADQAYDEMRKYDFNNGMLGGLFGGPPAQKRFVYSFYERHRSAAAAEAGGK